MHTADLGMPNATHDTDWLSESLKHYSAMRQQLLSVCKEKLYHDQCTHT